MPERSIVTTVTRFERFTSPICAGSHLLLPTEDVFSRYESMYPREEAGKKRAAGEWTESGTRTRRCVVEVHVRALLSGQLYSVSNPADEGVRCGTTMRSAPVAIYCYQESIISIPVRSRLCRHHPWIRLCVLGGRCDVYGDCSLDKRK